MGLARCHDSRPPFKGALENRKKSIENKKAKHTHKKWKYEYDNPRYPWFFIEPKIT